MYVNERIFVIICSFWNRLVFWKVRYVTSQTCVRGLQTEWQTSCKSFVLNSTGWLIETFTTKRKCHPSTRKGAKCRVCFADKLFVHLWELSAQQNKSWRHATTGYCVSRKGNSNEVTVRETKSCRMPWQTSRWRNGTLLTTHVLQNFCVSLCSLHTQVCEVDVPNLPKHKAVSKTDQSWRRYVRLCTLPKLSF